MTKKIKGFSGLASDIDIANIEDGSGCPLRVKMGPATSPTLHVFWRCHAGYRGTVVLTFLSILQGDAIEMIHDEIAMEHRLEHVHDGVNFVPVGAW